MQTLLRILLVLAMAGLMEAVHSVQPEGRAAASAVTLGVGFVLIVSLTAGKLAARIGLPKLTGYMAAGIAAGPFVFAYLDDAMVAGLSQINGVAVALIALTAGSEIDLQRMRPLIRSVSWISMIAVIGTAIVASIATFAMRDWLGFLDGMPLAESLAVAAVIGVVVASGSPAVVVAIRAETEADGPVARTVLGVVVIADLVVIVLFAIASSVARAVAAGSFEADSALRGVAWELFGSIGIGLLIGALLALALRVLRAGGLDALVLAVCLVAAEVGRRVHLDPLLLMLAAGMFVENVTGRGERLRQAYEVASLPVFIVFFSAVGASIRLDVLHGIALPALALVLVRAASLWGGTRVAASVSGAPPQVGRYGGFGLLPQAGLANALAILVARTFEGYGEQVSALLLGVVAVNAIASPVLFRIALSRSGEIVAPGSPPRAPEAAAA